MSILDDAIREHLELKRAHGADESELKRLEDEAFGPGERPEEPSPFDAEAPTEFLGAPEGAPEEGASARREPNVADLQEPPPPPAEEPPAEQPEAEAPEPPPPSEETHPATELRAVPDPAAGAPPTEEAEAPLEPPAAEQPEPPEEAEPPAQPDSPNTEERRAIAEQPTQFFDIEAEISAESEGAAGESPSPAAPPTEEAEAPPTGLEAEAAEAEAAEEPFVDDEEEDDFFSEQRLSEELDQALEAPLPEEERPRSRTEEPIPPGPHTEETEAHYAERDRAEDDFDEDDDDDDEGYDDDVFEPEEAGHDDVLEDTPDFLEDAPDADDAWFEQRPPKDFDFDD